MERSSYNSDVSDKQLERLQEYLPELSTRGAHLRKWELRVIINAILYVVTTGCQWRMLPKDFPPWQSVYYHYFIPSRKHKRRLSCFPSFHPAITIYFHPLIGSHCPDFS